MTKLTFLALLIASNILATVQSQTLKSLAEKHNKYIGVALNANLVNEKEYTDVLDREIDCLTPENAMKWADIELVRGKPTFEGADAIVKHAQDKGMKIRGHTLLWHQALPPWVEHGNFSASELKKIIQDRITTELGRYKGKLYAFDVVNEVINDGESGTLRESIFYKTIGRSFIADAFKFAHTIDPAVKLYINEYSVESDNPKSTGLYNLVKELKDAGVPIHGVGLQCHFQLGFVPVDFQKIMEKFVALDLEVAITELDISIEMPVTPEKLEKQGKDYQTVVQACVNVPKCVGVTMWGLTDKYSWIPPFTDNKRGAGLPFDEHYKEKPAYNGIKNALSK